MPGWRTRTLLALVLGSGGWFGCTENDPTLSGVGDQAATASKPALDADWTPEELRPLAWYVASASDFVARPGEGTVAWTDRMGSYDATSGTISSGWPRLVADGWFGMPTVHFDGGDLLAVKTWADAPADLSVLAVLRSAKVQDAAVAGFWDPNGGGFAWAALGGSDGLTLPELTRTFGLAYAQTYTGPRDLGTLPHVIVWRYAASTQTIEVTVDGTTTTSTTLAPIGQLAAMPFIIGAKSLLPTGAFTGDISELVIAGRALSDADVRDFVAYSRRSWPNLPTVASPDACSKADGSASPDSIRCDDGDALTFGDHCAAGACVGSVPREGSPAELATIAWYHAGAAEVALSDGRVATWFDRTSNHLDLSQGFAAVRPKLELKGWDGASKPVLTFGGRDLLRRTSLTGVTRGGESSFTVFGVVRSKGSERVGLASFSNSNGYGRATCRLESSAGPAERTRLASAAVDVEPDFLNGLYPELGTSRHVVVWQYSPAVAKLTVDRRTRVLERPVSLGSFAPAEVIVGGASEFGPDYFAGDIAELALISGTLSDEQLDKLSRYARDEWGQITLCAGACTGKVCGDDDGCGSGCPCEASP